MLVEAVEDAYDLEDAETGEGDQGDAFVGFLAIDGDDLGDEEEGVADQAEAEEDCDELLHGFDGNGASGVSCRESPDWLRDLLLPG